jgi:hypothetical protein
MSYIRCLSNPEKLYIWADCSDNVHISTGPEKEFKIPRSTFDMLIKLYVKDCGCEENYSYKGAKLIYERVPPIVQTPLGKFGDFKWVLTFKNNTIEMWETTWSHIVLNNMCRISTKKQVSDFVRLKLCSGKLKI